MGPSLPPHSQHSALVRLHSALNAARSRLHGLPDAGIGYSFSRPLWSSYRSRSHTLGWPSPSLVPNQLPHVRLRCAELSRDLSLRPAAAVQRPHLRNIFIRKFVRHVFTPQMPILFDLVSHVVCLRAKEQVTRVCACPVVAGVAYMEAIRNRAHPKHVCFPMHQEIAPDLSVAPFIECPLPRPALICRCLMKARVNSLFNPGFGGYIQR